jgi:hypothetical protein
MGLQSNGLSLEVVGREVSGRPVPGGRVGGPGRICSAYRPCC